MAEPTSEDIDSFISRWKKSGGHERGAGQQFLLELCALLDLPHPDPPSQENAHNSYTFEHVVTRKKPDGTTAPNWIDLYKAGSFVLETKQGVNPARDKADAAPSLPALPGASVPHATSAGHGSRGSAAFDRALERAFQQGTRYIHALPVADGRPPFLLICDVGATLDVYAEFSGTGGQYERFPDPVSHRIRLHDLHREDIRARLRLIWSDPHALDPARHAAAVTREVARALADLAKSLEKDGHDPQVTAGFLQRCLFTMFAEDIGLLPKDSFLALLRKVSDSPQGFPIMLRTLWTEMAGGTDFSTVILEKIPHFNGGLFEDATALPLRSDQIAYLIHAARCDWAAVEPTIFGTLLERALDPRERHKLGAHFTPRSYVERLVRRTLIDPLRAQWDAVRTAAAQLDALGKTPEARASVGAFHHHLCSLRILDPACGSGNFLYVALELLKRLEAEVLDLFETLGGDRGLEIATFRVLPHQFLGLEINPRAVAIAQLVLWIGFFQWNKKTTGKADTGERPLLPKTPSIRQQDAVLAYDARVPRLDEHGSAVTIWDGRTTKPHPVTGKEVPDETFRTTVFDYTNPRRAQWPDADYIIGNPPFLGNKRMRDGLGDGYVEALRAAWRKHKPDSWDFVMFWWHHASEQVRQGKAEQFGFITTNSVHQSYGRKCVDQFLNDKSRPGHLAFAIPDHPWVDAADGAAVRISMTVGAPGIQPGKLQIVESESSELDGSASIELRETFGRISSDFRIVASLQGLAASHANDALAFMGVKLVGDGFVVTHREAAAIDPRFPGDVSVPVRPLISGRDINQSSRDLYAIDLFGLSHDKAFENFPSLLQHLQSTVKPKRDHDKRKSYRDNWWVFAEPRSKLRIAERGLSRQIVTSEVSKHRFFTFINSGTIVDGSLITITLEDAYFIGVLSSTLHVRFTLKACGALEDRPRYQSSRCFDPYPFPALEESPLKARIRDLGEKLDGHRKRQQGLHPELTLTGMYNVLEALRAGTALTEKEKKIHDAGLVTLLKQIHDDLDAAVLEAYGWGDLAEARPLADRLAAGDEAAEALEQEILTRLVALNHARAEEEGRGIVRWLRPEYQAPDAAAAPAATQGEIGLEPGKPAPKPAPVAAKLPWPATLPAQVAALQKLLPALGPDPAALAAAFGARTKARLAAITDILETLRSLGKL